jgi:genome maintenance exonuclease 1
MIPSNFNLRINEYQFSKLERIDGEPRRYVLPDGGQVPSVTSVTGLTTKDGILKWRQKVGEQEANRISKKASGRGTVVHNLTEKYILNDSKFKESYDKAMPDAKDLFRKLQSVLNQYVTEIRALETPIWSSYLKVAGTVDCIGMFEGKLSVIDFKTASKTKEERYIDHYFMQTSAYACAWYELTGEPINNLVVLIANDEDIRPQIFRKTTYQYLTMFKQARDSFYQQYGF